MVTLPPFGEGRCFVIAEAGVNHNGSLDFAHGLVDLAADCGADAVKFQTFSAERLAGADAPKAAYQGDPQETQLAMLKRLELPDSAWPELAEHAAARNIAFLSSPFDAESAAMLARIGVPGFKIPSGEVTNLPFLRALAGYGLPIILSTGMATLDEVAAAVTAVRDAGASALALLHCVSAYPADPADCNLAAMRTLHDAFGVPVGWSDHTMGMETALAAVALGAAILEKHITLDRRLDGPDHKASADPVAFAALVAGVRTVESALGDGAKRPAPVEAEIAAVARKSLCAARDLAAGTVLAADMLAARRPGTGIPPAQASALVGRRLARALARGELLRPEDLA